uniref:ryncolin-1-like n=1 Tax=Styela clava TaxID=7725 RepID=UPI001939BC9C|nr:ryncolin-1-like [Styela clava]
METIIVFVVFVIAPCLSTPNDNFCEHVTQMHHHCIDENGSIGHANQGRPGKIGPKGPAGIQGPPGTVDYDIIDRKLRDMFQDTENRLNRKVASCEAAVENLKEELRVRTVTDCSKVSMEDIQSTSETGGIFDIYPGRKQTEVYCDMETDGGGWIVFQRRKDGSEDFFRSWNDYVTGFGNKKGEFWLGLETLHKITSSGSYELRVDLEDWSGVKKYARYSTFKIGSASTKYRINLGAYSGDATDSMSRENGMKFSTKDRDHDTWPNNCASAYKGAWWYGKCHIANLNGKYHKGGAHSTYADGINWHGWKGYNYSLKFTEMKIRPTS